MQDIEVTQEEIDYERSQWARDGVRLSEDILKELAIERKEYDLWRGQKMGKEGD